MFGFPEVEYVLWFVEKSDFVEKLLFPFLQLSEMVFEIDGRIISEDWYETVVVGNDGDGFGGGIDVGGYVPSEIWVLEREVVLGGGKDRMIFLLVEVKFGICAVGLTDSGFISETVCWSLASLVFWVF